MQELRPTYAFIVFLSGYCPLGLLLAIQDFNITTRLPDHPWLMLIILSVFLASTRLTAWHFKKYSNGVPVKICDVERKSSDLLNYAIPYIAGLVGIDPSKVMQVLAGFFLIWVVFYITYITQTVVINPFLAELGYQIHAGTIEYQGGKKSKAIIITKKQQLDIGVSYRLQSIGKNYFIETETQSNNQTTETYETR